MNFVEPAIFILFFAILSVPIATRFHLPLEIFLLIGSGILSFMPWLPLFQLNPQIVFSLFLPPILFYAAYFTSWRDFKYNIRPIGLLAFGLVIFTMLVVAATAKLILPSFSWAECFLLGAIVSPTDATSATNIIKKLGAPRRLIVILEGESMVNDATALILFRFSLAAILVGSFSFTEAVGNFILVASGGVVSGLAVGALSIFLIPKINSVVAETTFTFITAFVCYFLSESLGLSGIIATVVGGIYCGIHFPRVVTSATRINAKASWNTLMFIINGFVFTLIGLELPIILKNIPTFSLSSLLLDGVTISLIIILARLAWVYPMAYLPRLFFSQLAKKDPMPSWKILFVVGWTGMRGIVSLAAALSIPFLLTNGDAFPNRDVILLITYTVIVMTLIVPTLTLPIILPIFELSKEEDEMKQESLARIRSLENSIAHVKQYIQEAKIPEQIVNDFCNQLHRRLNVMKTQLNDSPYSTLTDDYLNLKRLMLTSIASERATLLSLRNSGELNEEVFHRLSDELDIEEMRTQILRI